MEQRNIRNFCIISHVDHGKSTLADRMLELTHTVDSRAMHPQYLDQMALEQERGITIKMQPVRMIWSPNHAKIRNPKSEIRNKPQIINPNIQNKNFEFRASNFEFASSEYYILNLIDTPGHVDFSYEVSRALAAVEGAILLVDATKGIQAQTVAHCEIAQKQGLTIIPAVNKVDLPQARVTEAAQELAGLLSISEKDVFLISAKDGTGVPELLDAVVARVPQPQGEKDAPFRALVFDSHFDSFRGTIAHVRVVDGAAHAGEPLFLMAKRKNAEALALGYFIPQEEKSPGLSCGEIGWVATGVKEPDSVRVGDTLTTEIRNSKFEIRNSPAPLPGYLEPQPAVFASFFPEAEDDFEKLRDAMVRLKLNDAALFFEPEQSQALGRGFRCGFLGMLHMDIVLERLRREFDSEVIATAPSVRFTILMRDGKEVVIHTPKELPQRGEIQAIKEPWVKLKILSPARYLSQVLSVLASTRAVVGETTTLGQDRVALEAESPMLDIIEQFADRLKSSTQGFASFSWEYAEEHAGDLVKLEVLVAHELNEAFSRIVPRATAEREAREVVWRLKEALPRQLFAVAIQAALDGKIVARETLPALRKDVTGYLYGGDFTRKKKLLQKQRKGKKRMEKTGRVHIPPDVFQKILQYKQR